MFIVNGVSGALLHCINFRVATDPACGSGNFLTETYISLRKLENEALRSLSSQVTIGIYANPIQVSIGQFYGIEINAFAVPVAKTARWLAESQMMKETEDIMHMSLDFLPLKSYANIVEGNALSLDWESVVPKHELNYIFPWPMPTEEQRAKIEETAQAILAARALYPDSSLADLYDETTMPPELRKAHQQNDKAVMRAYGFDVKTTTETTCVAELMRMYQKMTQEKNEN